MKPLTGMLPTKQFFAQFRLSFDSQDRLVTIEPGKSGSPAYTSKFIARTHEQLYPDSNYFDVVWEDCGCRGTNCCYRPVIYWKSGVFPTPGVLGQVNPIDNRKPFLVFWAEIDGQRNLEDEDGFYSLIAADLSHVPYYGEVVGVFSDSPEQWEPVVNDRDYKYRYTGNLSCVCVPKDGKEHEVTIFGEKLIDKEYAPGYFDHEGQTLGSIKKKFTCASCDYKIRIDPNIGIGCSLNIYLERNEGGEDGLGCIGNFCVEKVIGERAGRKIWQPICCPRLPEIPKGALYESVPKGKLCTIACDPNEKVFRGRIQLLSRCDLVTIEVIDFEVPCCPDLKGDFSDDKF